MNSYNNMDGESEISSFSRRGFLKKVLLAGSALSVPTTLFSNMNNNSSSTQKILTLYNIHSHEFFYAPFFEKNYYKLSGLFEINRAFIDYRTKEMIQVDVKLINFLYDIKVELGLDKQFNILSGYRSPKTNAKLRRRNKGVAKNSYHMYGKAVDFNVPGVSLRKLRDVAIGLKQGGVGYYPKSGFVHIDVGPVRTWRG